MFDLWSDKYSPIGLDLGSRAFRAVQLRYQKESVSVQAALEAERTDREQEPASEGANDYLSEDLSLLKRLIERGDFVGRKVALHCPADKLDLRPIQFPRGQNNLPRSAIIGALRLQVAGHLPFPVERAVFDYYTLRDGTEKDHMTVMAITADGQWIKERVNLLHSISLHCICVDAFPCVLSRLLPSSTSQVESEPAVDESECEEDSRWRDKVVAFLDMGYQGSTLVVRNQIGPVFCRRFPLGGKELTELLSQRLLVDSAKAERLKESFGLNSQARRLRLHLDDRSVEQAATAILPTEGGCDTEIGKTIYAAIQPELDSYVEGLIRSLNYVINEQNGVPLEKIILCGAASHLQNFDVFLAEQFSISVERYSHPLLDDLMKCMPASRAFSGRWTTALGLALAKEV